MNDRIKRLKTKRALGALLGVLGLLAAYFGFNMSYEAHKELVRIGEKNFGEFRIGEEKKPKE